MGIATDTADVKTPRQAVESRRYGNNLVEEYRRVRSGLGWADSKHETAPMDVSETTTEEKVCSKNRTTKQPTSIAVVIAVRTHEALKCVYQTLITHYYSGRRWRRAQRKQRLINGREGTPFTA